MESCFQTFAVDDGLDDSLGAGEAGAEEQCEFRPKDCTFEVSLRRRH